MFGTDVVSVFGKDVGLVSLEYVRRGVAVNCSVVEVGKDGKGVSGTEVGPVLSSLRTD